MVEVELKNNFELEHLIVGEVFKNNEGDELIVERNNGRMSTIVHEGGLGEYNEEYNMRIFNYDVVNDREKVIKIDCNGWGEIFLDDLRQEEYKTKLKEKHLW